MFLDYSLLIYSFTCLISYLLTQFTWITQLFLYFTTYLGRVGGCVMGHSGYLSPVLLKLELGLSLAIYIANSLHICKHGIFCERCEHACRKNLADCGKSCGSHRKSIGSIEDIRKKCSKWLIIWIVTVKKKKMILWKKTIVSTMWKSLCIFFSNTVSTIWIFHSV